MYARKYPNAQESKTADIIQIPENYDGNAFRADALSLPDEENEKNNAVTQETETEREEGSDEAFFETLKQACTSLPGFKTENLTSDMLLLLLVFLLCDTEEAKDLPAILLYLLLL